MQLKRDRGVIGCGHLVQVTQGHAHRSLDMTTNFTDAKGNKRIGKMWVGYAFHVKNGGGVLYIEPKIGFPMLFPEAYVEKKMQQWKGGKKRWSRKR